MPTYEFACTDCGEKFEVRASMSEKDKGLKPACPTCGSTSATPLLSRPSINTGGKATSSSCCSGPGCCGA